ncbi:MAG: AraC family transcriptional regulator [Spirochaetes bacterium]|nr:AraC family transcriptional regulator [Spirochaetota bacterium]
MKNKDIVYSALELIEENLKSDIDVCSVSQKFGFSLYYFSRLFKGITGYTLKDYILLRKISESYNDLIKTDKKIIDIAFEYGFGTHESYSRAFNRIIGLNPSRARRQERFSPENLISPLSGNIIENRRRKTLLEPEKVELEEIQLIGIPFYFDLALQNDLSKPWANLSANAFLIENRLIPEKYYQLQYWFADQEPDLFYFFIAVQVEKIENIPLQFTAKIIPKQKYLKFLHKGRSNTVGLTYQYIYNTYLPETDFRLPYLYNFELYGNTFLGPCNDDSVSEIYIPYE